MPQYVSLVKVALDSGCRQTIELCEILDLSYETVRRVVQVECRMNYVQCVPRKLKQDETERVF